MASIVEKICQTLCSEVHRPESLECTFNNCGQRHLETGVCCSKERDDGLQGVAKNGGNGDIVAESAKPSSVRKEKGGRDKHLLGYE